MPKLTDVVVRLTGFACCLGGGLALATPSISGLTGVVAHDGTVTITGSGFGVKSQATASLGDKYLYVIGADCKASNGFLLTSSPPVNSQLAQPIVRIN